MNFSEHNTMSDEFDGSPAREGGDEKHMTLSGGEFADTDASLTMEETPRLKFNSGAVLIVAVAAIAAVGLFSMRTLTGVSAAPSAPVEIEKSIDEFLSVVLKKAGERGENKEGVLDVLSESYALRQVPLEAVQRNPFIIFETSLVQAPAAPAPAKVDPLIQRRADRAVEFEKAGLQLRVGMIMMGSQPMANVNNRIVRVGESVPIHQDIEFRVVRITADRVEFLAVDAELGVQHERTVTLRRE